MNSILLISDDRIAVQHLRSALADAAPDCEIQWAHKREDLDAATKPAVIILDLMLASEAATEILRWLRTERRFQEVPVFVLGSEALKNEVEEAYSLGANSCFALNNGTETFEPIAGSIATYASLISGGLLPACA